MQIITGMCVKNRKRGRHMKLEYLRIRKINPHIPAIRVYQYLAQFNGVYPWRYYAN
jgi:hypothetical protein